MFRFFPRFKLFNSFIFPFLILPILMWAQAPTNGLVAYYPFNGNANDESNNSNNGIINGATLTIDRFGNANKAYSFNGANNNINGIWRTPLNSFSASFWINTSSLNNTWPCFVNIYQQSNPANGLHINLSTSPSGAAASNYYFSVHNQNTTLYSSGGVSLNKWTHLTITYQNGVGKIYIDGILDNTVSGITSGNWSSLDVFYFGQEMSGAQSTFYNGKLDDIRIYNRALSTTEITQLYNAEAPSVTLETGLVAHYPFSGNANDASGNGNNGTVYGATLANDRFGNANSAYNFDGSSNFIEVADANGLDFTTSFTLSAWINQKGINLDNSNNAYNGWIISKTNVGTADGYLVDAFHSVNSANPTYCSDSKSKIRFISSSSAFNSSVCYSFNDWHLVTLTYNNGNSKLFIDGQLTDNFSSPQTTIQTNNHPLRFGYSSSGSRGFEYFKGIIDDVSLYNRALSESEISQLYDVRNTTITKGVTVIVHGFSPSNDSPTWTADIANAIKIRANGGSIYKNNPNTGQWIAVGNSNSNNPNDEIILLYDWADLSNNGLSSQFYRGNGYLESGADNLFALLNSSPVELGNINLLDKPIHFIAHSRGTILSLQVFHRLKKYFSNKEINQFTLLDPHPATIFGDVLTEEAGSRNSLPCVLGSANGCTNTVGCNGVNDIQIILPDNVKSADCYYRQDGTYEGIIDFVSSFDGVPVYGLNNFNRQLKDDLIDAPNCTGIDWGGAHSKVHAWYYGTIANQGFTPYSGCTINETEPSNWYTTNIFVQTGINTNRKRVGYNQSRIGGLGYPSEPTIKSTINQMEAKLTARTGTGLRPVFNGDFNYGDGQSGWTSNGGRFTGTIQFASGNNKLKLTSADRYLAHSLFYFPSNSSTQYLRFLMTPTENDLLTSRRISIRYSNLDSTSTALYEGTISGLTINIQQYVYCPIPAFLNGKVGKFQIENLLGGEIAVDDFDFWTGTPPPSSVLPLLSIIVPVELMAFDVKQIKRNAQLIWQTATELNSDHFDIERSTDGKQFVKIGEIKAFGSTNQVQNYNYLDTSLPPQYNVFYYRLRQVDMDSKAEYSPIRSIQINKQDKKPNIKIYPNPTQSHFTLELEENMTLNNAKVIIFNIIGQSIAEQTFSGQKMLLDLSNHPQGTYFVKLKTENGLEVTHKIQKL